MFYPNLGQENGDERDLENSYRSMLSPTALTVAQSYLSEEESVFEYFLKNYTPIKKMNVCVVGGGVLPYLCKVLACAKKYIAIDPFMDLTTINNNHNNASKVEVISQSFQEYSLLRRENTNNVYFFWFNVASYIPDLFSILNMLLQKGDVIILSGWGDTSAAKNVFKKYFEHLGEKDKEFLSLKSFPFKKLQPVYVEKVSGQYTDINIIYK